MTQYFLPRYLPKRNENIDLQKETSIRMIKELLFFTVKNGEQPKCKINWRMDKQSVAYLY